MGGPGYYPPDQLTIQFKRLKGKYSSNTSNVSEILSYGNKRKNSAPCQFLKLLTFAVSTFLRILQKRKKAKLLPITQKLTHLKAQTTLEKRKQEAGTKKWCVLLATLISISSPSCHLRFQLPRIRKTEFQELQNTFSLNNNFFN